MIKYFDFQQKHRYLNSQLHLHLNLILLIEYYLIKGTIILIDGRGANAQFLRDNFRRKWIYEYFRKYDQHLFYLDADSFGPKNDLFLKFYQS